MQKPAGQAPCLYNPSNDMLEKTFSHCQTASEDPLVQSPFPSQILLVSLLSILPVLCITSSWGIKSLGRALCAGLDQTLGLAPPPPPSTFTFPQTLFPPPFRFCRILWKRKVKVRSFCSARREKQPSLGFTDDCPWPQEWD